MDKSVEANTVYYFIIQKTLHTQNKPSKTLNLSPAERRKKKTRKYIFVYLFT